MATPMITELAIIGSGPAGLAAAKITSAYGVETLIIDEQARPGGQILRQPPKSFKVANWLSSSIYDKAKDLLSTVSKQENVRWLRQSTVLGIEKSTVDDDSSLHIITLSSPSGPKRITARAILVATGCYDMPVAFPGWNLPGVMATGGIQAFMKSQQVVPGNVFFFSGTHPLQLIVAQQIVAAGGKVVGIAFAQPFFKFFQLCKSPSIFLRHPKQFVYLASVVLKLYKAKVPIMFNRTIIQANGKEALENIAVAPINAKGQILKEQATTVNCDRLGICFSFLASTELPKQYAAESVWSDSGGGWIIKCDGHMQSSVDNLYVAGETTGVAGADVAMLEGELAGLSIVDDFNKIETEKLDKLVNLTRKKLLHASKFAAVLRKLSYPGKNFFTQLQTDSTTLCKCEEVSIGEIKQFLSENEQLNNANAMKLISRSGMGLCQGRYCSYNLTQLLSNELTIAEEEVGPLKARFPTKPVQISQLLEMEPK